MYELHGMMTAREVLITFHSLQYLAILSSRLTAESVSSMGRLFGVVQYAHQENEPRRSFCLEVSLSVVLDPLY